MTAIIRRDTYDAYAAASGWRASDLKLIYASPRAYRWARDHGQTETPAMARGTAVHTLVLEPDEFAARYAVFDGVRRGHAWETFRDGNAGREILTQGEYDTARWMADSVLQDIFARLVLDGVSAERSFYWSDEETGAPLKCRVDFVGPRAFGDLKTTRDPRKHAFCSDAYSRGYHLQLAMQHDACVALAGEAPPGYVIAIGSSIPYETVVYEVPDEMIENGRNDYRAALRTLAECTERNVWPGSATTIQRLDTPGWYRARG